MPCLPRSTQTRNLWQLRQLLKKYRSKANHRVAVGQGALVLINDDVGKREWALADLNLPPELRSGWDFHAVALAGNHIWVVGRPGSVLLHSGNRGGTWEVIKTKVRFVSLTPSAV